VKLKRRHQPFPTFSEDLPKLLKYACVMPRQRLLMGSPAGGTTSKRAWHRPETNWVLNLNKFPFQAAKTNKQQRQAVNSW